MNCFAEEQLIVLKERVKMLHEKEVSRVLTESKLIDEIDELKKSQNQLKQLIQLTDKKIETIRKIKDRNHAITQASIDMNDFTKEELKELTSAKQWVIIKNKDSKGGEVNMAYMEEIDAHMLYADGQELYFFDHDKDAINKLKELTMNCFTKEVDYEN